MTTTDGNYGMEMITRQRDACRVFFIAVKGLVFSGDRFLIVRRSSQSRDEEGYWELPGGRLDFGETAEEALTRELREEIGLDVRIERPMYTWTIMRDDSQQTIGITFLCRATSQEVTLSREHDAYAWITLREIDSYHFPASIRHDLRKLDIATLGLNKSEHMDESVIGESK